MSAASGSESLRLGAGGRSLMAVFAVLGVLAVGLAVLTGGWQDFLGSYLTAFCFVLSLSLGALFFVILQHLTRAGWSVTVRRLAEVMASNVLVLAVLFIPVIVGLADLYEWAHEGEGHVVAKGGWFGREFFVIRIAVYFGVWILLSRFFLRNSVRQDESGDPALTLRMQKLSPVSMILFAITLTFAAFDLLMSLDPHWYSTIFGVYYFSGGVVGFFAFLIPMLFLLQRAGKLGDEVTVEHYHDLGKQLFGYVVFWAYIAFSQYMLLWYANIPEETWWLLLREEGGWGMVGLLLVFGHFALPFLALLPRAVKRSPPLLAAIAVFILVMHWVDVFWLAAPGPHATALNFGITDILCAVGLLALFAAATLYRLSSLALMPEKDPRLAESIAFENI